MTCTKQVDTFRLWRTVKYELIYLHEFSDGRELYGALSRYFEFYNASRPHQSLGYRTPSALYHGERS